MTFITSLGLMLSAAHGMPAAVHTVSIQHASGPVEAEYRGEVDVQHRQIGSPAPGGRPSTLRCAWTAHLAVDRIATSTSNAMASRNFTRNDIASGSRPGWCRTNRAVIARDVAARIGDVERHVALAAQDDTPALQAELDRLIEQRNAG